MASRRDAPLRKRSDQCVPRAMDSELDQLRLQECARHMHAATAADAKRRWREAIEAYQTSLGILEECIRREHNEHFRKGLVQKASDVLRRIATIEAHCGRKQARAAAREAQMRAQAQAQAEAQQAQTQTQTQTQAPAQAQAQTQPPSTMLMHVSHSKVQWDDVQGLEEAKRVLRDAVETPQKYPNFFGNGIEPWKGVLLYGPPGTGKTMLAKAVAFSVSAMRAPDRRGTGNFFSVSASDIMNRYVGESERRVKQMFVELHANAPCVLFIDEIDSLMAKRDGSTDNDAINRVKSEFLIGMEGLNDQQDVSQRVLVIGATNFPWDLDEAALRRLERRVYVPLPDAATRKLILKKKVPPKHALTDADFDALAEATDLMSGSDISTLCKEAVTGPLAHVREATRWVRRVDGERELVVPLTRCAAPGAGADAEECDADPCTRCGSVVGRLDDFDPLSVTLRLVERSDFERALRSVRPTVSPASVAKFEAWSPTVDHT